MTGDGKGGLTIRKFLIINVLYLRREVFCIILMVQTTNVRRDSRETAAVAVALYTVVLWYCGTVVSSYSRKILSSGA